MSEKLVQSGDFANQENICAATIEIWDARDEIRSKCQLQGVRIPRDVSSGGGGAKNLHVKGEGENMRMGKRKENTSKTRV